ncbi:MAG: hypothetical protein K0R54_4398 [Clostridiaceae bacterium]|jgi:hypothetical protein|nr:hypothetical protein [Clostridiaceae bacterium]
MQALTKSQFMQKVINDKYAKRLKKLSGDKDAVDILIKDIDISIKNGSRGNKRLTSW